MFIPALGVGGLAAYRLIQRTETTQLQAVSDDAQTQREIAYFRENIGAVQSAEDLLRDRQLLSVALTAYGLESEIDKGAFVSSVLDGGVEDSSSFANRLNDPRWSQITRDFGFNSSTAGQELPPLHLAVELAITTAEANSQNAGFDIATSELEIFRANIRDVTTAEDLVADETLKNVALTVFGLEDEHKLDSFLLDVLNSDVDDEDSFVNQLEDTRWLGLAIAFTAEPADGQEETSLELVVEGEIAAEGLRSDYEPLDIDADDLAAFRERIGDIETAEQLLADEQLRTVALTAFGLEDETVSDAFIQSILEDDITDETAFVNLQSDDRWRALNEAFNGVSASGGRSAAFYQYEVEKRLIALEAPQEDLDYLRRNIDLLDENINVVIDPKLQDIVLSAFGLEKDTYSSEFVLNMVISDPSESTSFVSVFNDDRWSEFVGVFGSLGQASNTNLESFQNDVVDRFLTRSLEIGVGEVDEDVRIALNFRNSIDRIASDASVATSGWFTLLGDQALRSVVDAAFNLPTEFAQIDVDQQEGVLRQRAQLLFGGDDPSVFLDADNVDTAIQRFFLRQQTEATSAQSQSAVALSMLNQAVQFGQQQAASLNQRF
ncbi:MAG: DUF1217 domain-containing protein [Rhodobacteraceae bacterium]|nr:DUF1217 domain-containing protein [Paracoccaceae bacterium]